MQVHKKTPGKIRRIGNRGNGAITQDLPDTLEKSLYDKMLQLTKQAQDKGEEPLFAGDSFARNAMYYSASIGFKDDPDTGIFCDPKGDTALAICGTAIQSDTKIDWSGTTINTDGTGQFTGDSIYIGDDLNNPYIHIGYPIDNEPYHISQPNHLMWPNAPQTPNPYSIGVSSIGTSTLNFGLGNDKYAVMNLPRNELPLAVYVCGRMLTLGILGTDVECAYTGKQVVFEPGVISAIKFGNRITVSVEYRDEIYHYNVGRDGIVTYESEKSSTLETTLVSTINKDGALTGGQ